MEYYWLPSSSISASVFHKNVKNQVTRARRNVLFQYDVDGDGTLERFPDETGGELSTLVSWVNAGIIRTIRGVQISGQTHFKFLPPPLDGFGAALNYTRIENTNDLTGIDDLSGNPINDENLSRQTLNAISFPRISSCISKTATITAVFHSIKVDCTRYKAATHS